jgi:hypothetical protein
MFRNAIEIVNPYTFKVVVAIRRMDGKVDTAIFTALALNETGDFLSCAHAFHIMNDFKKHQELMQTNLSKRDEIKKMDLNPDLEKREILKTIGNPHWITHIDFYLPKLQTSIDLDTLKVDPKKDLATFRLKKWINPHIKSFPRFYNNYNHMQVGTSLCRLGFAFNATKVAFVPNKGFLFIENKNVSDSYPNDGILTRIRQIANIPNLVFNANFIETSTPGLKGQSGGAIFDTEGIIYGIQSHTSHLPLDMAVPFPQNGPVVTLENQVLNVGLAVHAKEIEYFLESHNIAYNTY